MRWTANRLNPHPDKTKCMYVGTRQRLSNFLSGTEIVVNNHSIFPSDQMKSLGVILDKNLNWSDHVDLIIKKVKPALSILRRAKPFVTQYILIQIYNALILPHFDYCSEVWSDLNKGLADTLQKLQNRAARIITGATYDTRSKDVLKSLGWYPLHTRRTLLLASLMFKCINNSAPDYLLIKVI